MTKPTLILNALSLVLSTCLCIASTHAQEKVQNTGFEEFTSLPSGLGQYGKAEGWKVPNGSTSAPDFFHYYSPSSASDLPETPVAIVDAFNGSRAVMGLIATSNDGANYREYLTQEISELQPGKRYIVSFHMCNGDITPSSTGGLGVADFGVHLSKDPLTQPGYEPIILEPTFKIDTTFYSRDWQRVSFVFEPSDVVQNITIGLFEDPTTTEIREYTGNAPNMSYYFLDEVSIEEVDDINAELEDPNIKDPLPEPTVEVESGPHLPTGFTPNNDGLNDFFAPVIGEEFDDYQFKIFNRWGSEIFSTTNHAEAWSGKSEDGKTMPIGTYYWVLSFTTVNSRRMKMQQDHTGYVTLLK